MVAMKLRVVSLSVLALCLTLPAVVATAQTVYSNGPINGNVDAWEVSFGYIVSDTFNVTNNNTTITGGSFGMWLFPGDTLTSAELSITSGENGGTSYFDQTLNFTQGSCTLNQYGYDVCRESTTFNGPTLNVGTYWLNLQNAIAPGGDPAFWDENAGPSSASTNEVGSIPSEAFTVLGTSSSTTTSTTTTSVPEPSSIMLFGSGILGLASLLRRKLF
jgi:PEP-CTERM motif